MPNNENFYSEEAHEIMSTIPPRLIRWGITVIFLIFTGIIIASSLIEYPETIKGRVNLTLTSIHENDSLLLSNGKKFKMKGRIYLPSKGFGKVAVNQTVYVSLDCFPAMEFGKLKGKITHIYPHLQDNQYLADIEFPSGLTTTGNKCLRPIEEMQGEGEIIIQNKRLIHNLTEPIQALFKK